MPIDNAMTKVAYCSPYVPVEWIAAHGLNPLWLRLHAASNRSMTAVTRGICPYAGALIDMAMQGIEANGLVLTTICDQMRYAAALAENGDGCPVFLLNVPSTWQTAESKQLYIEELRRLSRFLVWQGGTAPSNAELAEVMKAYDRARQDVLEASSKYSSRQVAEALANLRGSLTNGIIIPYNAITRGIPLAIVGGPLLEADYAFFDMLENAGGRIVLDATEGGFRTLPKRFDPTKAAVDPLQELAESYFDVIPDVFRQPNAPLYDWLGQELGKRQVRGIIFRRYVWCDLWHAELKRMKDWSPVPVLEIDIGSDDASCSGRIRSRVEAFLEMLA